MTQGKIIVVGANGELGREVLRQIGPGHAIAASRHPHSPAEGFIHTQLTPSGSLDPAVLEECRAIVNAAGRVHGEKEALFAANVDLPLALARSAMRAGVPRMVQVSSFAVFGAAEHIHRALPANPMNDYGRSKLEGDIRLLELMTDSFSVQSLRLPLLFSPAKPGLLEPLAKMAQRIRILPTVSQRSVLRSMITYSEAARWLKELAEGDKRGVAYAADPEPFEMQSFANLLREHAGVGVQVLKVNDRVAQGITRLAPPIGRRLFQSSLLDPADNLAANSASNLQREMASWIRKWAKR